jgi:hypothetical protein
MWIGLLVALLVGGLIGYLIGWNLAPADTETLTVTETATVAPPAYTLSTSVDAQVRFDGESCLYGGPAEVTADTQVAFAYTATVANSALIVWQVLPGITYEEISEAVATRAADEPPKWLADYGQSEPVDARQQTLEMPLGEGMWVVSCATNPETTNQIFMSTVVRAVGG